MKKIKFIINPISGVGKQKTIEKLVNEHLDKNLFEFDFAYTEKPKHAIDISSKAVNENYDVVVAVGGDGSVNEAGQALIESDTALGIIPTGSGNGLARHMGIPTDLVDAIKTLNSFKVMAIDTAILNDKVFLGTAGIGFDAHIAWLFSQFGNRGFISYIRLVLKEYIAFKEETFQLTIDGREVRKEAFFIAFANSAQYGNNAAIAPHANITDGLLDICISKKIPIINALSHIRMLFNQRFSESKYVEIIKAKHILIEQHSGIAHIDGEPIKPGKKLEVNIVPSSLKVIIP